MTEMKKDEGEEEKEEKEDKEEEKPQDHILPIREWTDMVIHTHTQRHTSAVTPAVSLYVISQFDVVL